jgi:N utilization substance protein B
MLYQIEVGRVTVADAVEYHGGVGDAEAADYAVALVRGCWQSRDVLDGYIADAARNWRIERLATVDHQLLRLAIHELMALPATPPRVVIDEAIELARRYSGDEAARFVNGVLDGVFKRLKDEGKAVDET